MHSFLQPLRSSESFRRLVAELMAGGPAYVEGLWGSSAALLTAALAQEEGAAILVALPSIEQAETFFEDLAFFAPGRPMMFPAWETQEDEAPDAEILSQRLQILQYLVQAERPSAGESQRIIVAPVQALLQPVPAAHMIASSSLRVARGETLSQERIIQWLVEREFQPVRRVEVPGEFCRRGGILDVFPYASEEPVRIEFFGDEIESLRRFDPETQVGTTDVSSVTLAAIPRHHVSGQSHADTAREHWASLFDHLPKGSRLILKEPAEVLGERRGLSRAGHPEAAAWCREALRRAVSLTPTLHMAALPGVFGGKQVTFHVHSTERFGRDLATTIQELELVASERRRTVVLCSNEGERDRLLEILADARLPEAPQFEIRIGRLNHGFDWSDLSLALLPHHELFNRYRQRRVVARYRHTKAVDSFYELNPGDLVVHAVHGIGLFRGTEVIRKGPDRQECLRVEYADKAFLYVPAAQIELVQRYIGPSEHRPPLSKLGSRAWLRRKEKTEEAIRDLAAELLRMQAVREAKQGIAHPADDDWQQEFEAAFPFEETEDQLRIAAEVKRDMEQSRPMDRLICGDVGYGKTEIAMRAAFKAVAGGRQAAVLVPTTVLAAQHQTTFSERMADYPVRVEMLSRFLTRGQQAQVIASLAQGRTDIVIGTHRLVQPDVHFKDLGLVIIDEEQRFGVEHKERLKRLRATVDVLTLTATPIPRTLHMALLGIRDIAALETPPRDRLAIHTRLLRYNPDRLRQAILHEMARGGQAFFVHNRVQSIAGMARELRALIPEARIVVGHGQMPEKELSGVMRRFVEGEADVLVCTTIIESGLDIPNANTIIINKADMFGLAELHQLRGRVGRYKHRAYAYMVVPAERPVTPIAEKRLKAIEEFCELGAGFRIAMRDLELRGAGNILGPEQSGHIAAVGYDMYCRLLDSAVHALRNEPISEPPELPVSIGLDAFLPDTYVSDTGQRIEIYRKLQRATHQEDIAAVEAELHDRFGPPPPEAENLLSEAALRLFAAEAGVSSILFRDGVLMIRTSECDRVRRLLSAGGRTVRQVDDETLYYRPDRARNSGAELLSFLLERLGDRSRVESGAS